MTTRRKWFLFVGVLLAVGLILFSIAVISIPMLVQNLLIPRIEAISGADIDCEIRKIGVFSSEFNDIRISKGGRRLFESDQIRAKYYLWGLGGVRDIRICGLRIRLDGPAPAPLAVQTTDPSLDAPVKSTAISGTCGAMRSVREFMRELAKGMRGSGGGAVFGRTRFSVSGGELYVLNAGGEKRIIPFDCEIDAGKGEDHISFAVEAEPFSGRIKFSGDLDKKPVFSMKSEMSDASLSEIYEGVSGKLSGDASASLSELELDAKLCCEIRNLRFEKGALKVVSGAESPARLDMRLRNDEVEFSLGGVELEKPVPLLLGIENGRIKLDEKSLRYDGMLKVSSAGGGDGEDVEISALDLSFEVKGDASDDSWHLSCRKTGGGESIVAKSSDAAISSGISDMSLEMTGGESLSGVLRLKAGAGKVLASDFQFEVPGVDVEYLFGGGASSGFAKFAGAVFRKGELSVSGIGANAKFADGPAADIEVDAGAIEFAGREYGNAAISGRFADKSLDMKGAYSLPSAGYDLPIEMRADFSKGKLISVKAANDDYVKLKKFDLGIFTGAMAGFSCEGALKLSYVLEMRDGELSSRFENTIKDFSIENVESGVKIEGLEGAFSSDDPAMCRSLPKQRMKAKSLVFGGNRLSDLELVYALESPRSFFIESFDAGWCGGELHLSSSRIDGSGGESFTVYFDRILLSEMLRELGICEAGGDGRVNGRVPVVFDGGRIDFDDAFFYSSPGTGGNIKVRKAGEFMSDIPAEGAQFSSMDLTLEALKDFDYDWSRISVDSEGDEIVAKLEFLGRPSGPLPFRLDRQTGVFSRVEASSQGSTFEEIKLDLNCRFPLNAIMRYIKVFKSFLTEKGVR